VPIKKGSIVLFKPDQSTPLEQLGIKRGYEDRELPLLKRVVALAGDVVSVSSSGVSINGQLLPNSAPLFDDEAGRPLKMAKLDHCRLGTDQAFLMGVTTTSWDSRYFGRETKQTWIRQDGSQTQNRIKWTVAQGHKQMATDEAHRKRVAKRIS
jgi:conjugative transfer signal peptidase TraF